MQLLILSTVTVHHGSVVLLKVLAVLKQASSEDVHNNVGLTDVNEHVVFQYLRRREGLATGLGRVTYDWVLLSDKGTVPNPQVLDEVGTRCHIVHDLEVATAVLLRCLLVLVRDYEVVYHAFLNEALANKVRSCDEKEG